MNLKFGLMTGAAIACAVMTGCKAPKAQTSGGATMEPTRSAPRTEIVTVEEKPAETAKPDSVQKVPEVAHCKCASGTVHDTPCTCGAPDCKCKVKAPEPEYTVYRVKSGDMLSAICATYGLKQKKVLELNPGLDANKLYAGRTIKLPGKIELKNAAPAVTSEKSVSAAKPAAAKRVAKASSYKGATKEYVVTSGDSLGKIAYSNGITVKCLKEMNGLKNNTIRIGQKLKVPAEKPVAEAKPEAEKKSAATKAAPAEAPKQEVKPEAPAAAPVAESPAATSPVVTPPVVAPEEKQVEAAPAVEQVKDTTAALESGDLKTHTVKEGEDMVSIAILYNVSPSAIMDLNDLKNTDTLTPGQVLKLPANAKMQ